MSVETLASGRFQARWRDATGRQCARSFTSRKAAEDHERAMRVEAANGGVAPTRSGTTIAAYADAWLAGARSLAPGTLDTYRRDLDRYILPTLGGIRLTRLQPAKVDQWLTDELAAGVAPSSVHRHYRTLHRLYTVAQQRRAVASNPLEFVEPPRVPAVEMRFLTVDELDRLVAATRARWAAMIDVAGWCGLRWGELLGLRRRDIDGARITVDTQMVRRTDKTWERTAPKTAAGRRTVTAPKATAERLRRHLTEHVLAGDDAPVFWQPNGNPPPSSSFAGNIWSPALIKAGLKAKRDAKPEEVPVKRPPRFHDLRHTAVAFAIATGAHPKTIQARMGHSSIRVTMDRYGHLFPDIDEGLADGLDKLRG